MWIKPDFRCEFGKNISIGNNVYINLGCIILDCAEVIIGNHVLIVPSLGIYAVNHGFDPEERIAGACMGTPVYIEDNVWISGDVKILAGVTIGEGSIIGGWQHCYKKHSSKSYRRWEPMQGNPSNYKRK
ncbi:MAG: hypothetical protein K2O65_00320 [Lachnospiraceae bacterium]|nr:hypothetical protein [Lachnospiraceae bacterium]